MVIPNDFKCLYHHEVEPPTGDTLYQPCTVINRTPAGFYVIQIYRGIKTLARSSELEPIDWFLNSKEVSKNDCDC